MAGRKQQPAGTTISPSVQMWGSAETVCPPWAVVSTSVVSHGEPRCCRKCKNFSPISPLLHLWFPKHFQCCFFFFSSTCSYSLSGVHFISPFYVCPSCLDKRKSKINIRHWSALRASLFWGVVSLLTWSPSENMPHVSSILELMLLWHVCSPTQGFYERKKTNYRRLWRRCLIPSAIKSKAKAITLL